MTDGKKKTGIVPLFLDTSELNVLDFSLLQVGRRILGLEHTCVVARVLRFCKATAISFDDCPTSRIRRR